MKLILMQYLASLRERGELDVIMPDLLSEVGFSVISKPAIGTKQYGVDLAAVGVNPDTEVKTLFLIAIKPGDLKRSSWDVGAQSLRTSLNQVLDVYVPSRIPKRYDQLPVVIVLCIGGDIHEDVSADVEGFFKQNTNDKISFSVWNGDILASFLLSGILRENALPDTWRSYFRKSVALVDEPDVSFKHFRSFVNSIADAAKATQSARLRAIRQIYLGLWTLFVWARDAENTEASYLCSEHSLLVGWSLAKNHLDGRSKAARQLRQSMDRLVELHITITDDYIASYIAPRAGVRHGLSAAVPSRFSLDVNLRLFDLVGRVGMRGLWQLEHLYRNGKGKTDDAVQDALQGTVSLLMKMIRNNPILFTPIRDDQAIEVNTACLFLIRVGCKQFIKDWIGQISRGTIFAFHSNDPYPCVYRDYRDLVNHPKLTPDYRTEATAGSLLVPTLAAWAAITGDVETLRLLADFTSGPYKHSTLQLWYPGQDTEAHLYRGSANHGMASTGIRIERLCGDMLSQISKECAKSDFFYSLSAIRPSYRPLVILACRHHRIPVPPHFWPLSSAVTDVP